MLDFMVGNGSASYSTLFKSRDDKELFGVYLVARARPCFKTKIAVTWKM